MKVSTVGDLRKLIAGIDDNTLLYCQTQNKSGQYEPMECLAWNSSAEYVVITLRPKNGETV